MLLRPSLVLSHQRYCSFLKNVYTVFSVNLQAVGFAELAVV